jgi:hypothetical protein
VGGGGEGESEVKCPSKKLLVDWRIIIKVI